MKNVVTEAVTTAGDRAWSELTFPTYRHLLGLDGTSAAGRSVVARGARFSGRLAALALAQVDPDEEYSAQLLSLYVVPDLRGQGIAAALLGELEDDLVGRGVTRLAGSYMTGRPTLPALERVLAKRAFEPPILRSVAVRFTPEEASQTLWYRRAKLPSDSEIFPWTDLTPEERRELRESPTRRAWIHPELEPWRFDDGFDEVSSVGLRKSGQVVGWVINHRIDPAMVRFTISFVRNDLARRGGIFALYVGSLERLLGSGVMCTFVTAAHFVQMNRFVLRRCAPYITFCGETRGVSKTLPGD